MRTDAQYDRRKWNEYKFCPLFLEKPLTTEGESRMILIQLAIANHKYTTEHTGKQAPEGACFSVNS